MRHFSTYFFLKQKLPLLCKPRKTMNNDKTPPKESTAPQQETGGDCQKRLVLPLRWGRLRHGNILGVVDSYGAVHSVFTGEKVDFHADHFATAHHCQWRWNDEESINWITAERKPNEEQYDAIQRHLTRKYGLKWWKNGHHDIDHLQAKWAEENSRQNEK